MESVVKRESWLDIGKFLAAVLIVVWHVPCFTVSLLASSLTMGGNVAFFMILAGYFMGKNVKWEKCLTRFIALLIPFLIWNFVVSFEYAEVPYMRASEYFCRLVGYKSLFIPSFNPFGVETNFGQPFSSPTWFLRDLLLCTLLAPLLIRIRLVFIPFIIMAFCLQWSVMLFSIDSTLSPLVLAEFGLGLCLSRYDVNHMKSFFERNEKSMLVVWIFLMGLSLLIGFNNYFSNVQNHAEWSINQYWHAVGVFNIHWNRLDLSPASFLVGAFFILFMGFLLDKYCNKRGLLTKLSGASFLLFVLHYPLLKLIPTELWKSSLIVIVCGIAVVIGGIIAFYLFLCRYLPWTLPYLANVRSYHKTKS